MRYTKERVNGQGQSDEPVGKLESLLALWSDKMEAKEERCGREKERVGQF